MQNEKPELELARLLKEQDKARTDEVFGGFSQAERKQCDASRKRIQKLQFDLMVRFDDTLSNTAEAKQRRDWNKVSEIDIHREQARQPYRSREKDSVGIFRFTRKTQGRTSKGRTRITRWAFESAYERHLLSDWIALAGHAADPISSASEARRKLYFQW
jgi:hypothetical protein